MQYCKCTNDFVNAIIDDYFNSFKIRKDLTEGLVYEWTNSMEQIHDRYSDEEIITPTEPTLLISYSFDQSVLISSSEYLSCICSVEFVHS